MGKFKNFMLAVGLTGLFLQSYIDYFPKRYQHLVDLMGNHDGRASQTEKDEFLQILRKSYKTGDKDIFQSQDFYVPFVKGKDTGDAKAYFLVNGKEVNCVNQNQVGLSNLEFRLHENNRPADLRERVGLVHIHFTPCAYRDERAYARYIKPVSYYVLTINGLKEQGWSDNLKRELEILFAPIKNEKPRKPAGE